MRYALDSDGEWLLPLTSGATAVCIGCGSPVYARAMSSVRVAKHWSHYGGQSCSVTMPKESETAWHREWKDNAPKKYQEVTVRKDGVTMRADVKAKTQTVFEMQHSNISEAKIVAREEHYGRNQLWICDGRGGRIRAEQIGRIHKWHGFPKYNVWADFTPPFARATSRPTFLDNGDKIVRLLKGDTSSREGAFVGIVLPTEVVRDSISEACAPTPLVANFFFDSVAEAEAIRQKKKRATRRANEYSTSMVCPSIGDLYQRLPAWIQDEIVDTTAFPKQFRIPLPSDCDDANIYASTAPRCGPAGRIAMAVLATKGEPLDLNNLVPGKFTSIFMAENAVKDALRLGYVAGFRSGYNQYSLKVTYQSREGDGDDS